MLFNLLNNRTNIKSYTKIQCRADKLRFYDKNQGFGHLWLLFRRQQHKKSDSFFNESLYILIILNY